MTAMRINPAVRTGGLTNASSALGTLNSSHLYRFGNLVICWARWTNVGSQTGANVMGIIPYGFRPVSDDVYGTFGHTGSITGEMYSFAASNGNLTIAGNMANVSQVFVNMCWYTNDA